MLGAVSERPVRRVSGFARFGLVAKRNQNGGDAQSRVRAAEAREEPPESGLRRPHAIRGGIWGTYANCPLRSSIETGGWVRRTENILILAYLHYWIGVSLDNACEVLNFFTGLVLSKSQADSLLSQLSTDWTEQYDAIAGLIALQMVVYIAGPSWPAWFPERAVRRHSRAASRPCSGSAPASGLPSRSRPCRPR